MGNRRPCPPRKPILSEGTTKSTKIAVTVPRGGLRPIPGNTFGKYHPFFTSEYGCVKSDFSQCLLSDAVKQQGEVIDTPLGVDALSTGMGAQMAGPMGDSSMVMDKNPQELKPALQVQTGSESVTYSSQANVTSPRNNGQCSRFFGSASEELHTVSPFCVADYANSPSSGPSVMASPIIPVSNTGTPSPLSNNCCDNFRSSLDLSGTDTVVSAKAGVTTPSKQQVVLASGQPEVFTPAAFKTPTNSIAADELVLDKAKRRAAIRNLDNPAGTYPPGNIYLKLPMDNSVAKLKSIGISMGSSSKEIIVSSNALKRIEVDKVKVQPKNKRADTDLNPFDLSDEEDPENENRLLSHLIKDITDVDLDDLDLGMRICDLKVTGRKSKSTAKKAKARKKTQKLNKSVSP